MSIQISTTHWLRYLFEERGWSRLPTPSAARRFGLTIMVAPDGTTATGLVDAIDLRPPHLAGRDLPHQFEAWLHRLLATLDRLREREIPIHRLFFTGGGPITLPRWFREECEARGLRLHTVSTDAPPAGLERFMEHP